MPPTAAVVQKEDLCDLERMLWTATMLEGCIGWISIDCLLWLLFDKSLFCLLPICQVFGVNSVVNDICHQGGLVVAQTPNNFFVRNEPFFMHSWAKTQVTTSAWDEQAQTFINDGS